MSNNENMENPTFTIKSVSPDLDSPVHESTVMVGDFIKITSETPNLNDIWEIEYVNNEKMVIMKLN